MASSETGYAKNAANAQDLIIRLKTLGTDYKPPKDVFEIKALENLSKGINDAMQQLNQVLPIYRKAVDEQEIIFKPLNNLITRSYNYLKAAIDHPDKLQTAKTLADQLRGVSKKSIIAGAAVSSHTRTSYDNKIENFKHYINVLTTSGVYEPMEEDISIPSFQTLITAMENNITAVALAKTPVDDARQKRFTLFYAERTGLVDIVTGIKNYIRASLTKDHPGYKHILALSFKK